jgi:hypothetical protein
MLAQQIRDKFLPRVAGKISVGYMRLKAEGEIMACLTGTCAYFIARSRKS